MGLLSKFKKNKISVQSVKNKTLTNNEIEKLRDVKSNKERLQIIKKSPYILPYVINRWSAEGNIDSVVKTAIKLLPENVTRLGKGNVMPTEEYVKIALLSKPSVIFQMNDDLKNMISIDTFIKAFVKDPDICASDAKVLKAKISRKVFVKQKGVTSEKELVTTVRSECLKAIRLATGVSKYHAGYDDYADVIADDLRISHALDKYQTKDNLATKLPTIVNTMIKKQDIRLYAMPVEVWKLNNYKTLYTAVKEATKKGSAIGDILEFIPFGLLPKDVTKRVVGVAIKNDPEVWNKLQECNLDYLKSDAYIQYAEYKSCKEHKNESLIEQVLTETEIKKASGKYKGIIKRKKNRVVKAKQLKLPSVIYKFGKKEEELTF
jgi:hypothetical protein